MNTIQPPGLSDAWLEIAEYTLDASKVVFGSDNYPVAEFADYDEYVKYPEWKDSSEIKMSADKYTEVRAEKALVSAGLILDAARAYVA